MRTKVMFILAVLMIAFSFEASAQGKKVRMVEPVGQFNIVGYIDVEYPANSPVNFSIANFRQENKREFAFFRKKLITDENFGVNIVPGEKKRMYLVRPIDNKRFTYAQAMSYIEGQEDAELPSVAWMMLATHQYGPELWSQNTMCFSEKVIENKGYDLMVYYAWTDQDEGGFQLAAIDWPYEGFDFVFMTDVPDEEGEDVATQENVVTMADK